MSQVTAVDRYSVNGAYNVWRTLKRRSVIIGKVYYTPAAGWIADSDSWQVRAIPCTNLQDAVRTVGRLYLAKSHRHE